jgi:hypothetical protein
MEAVMLFEIAMFRLEALIATRAARAAERAAARYEARGDARYEIGDIVSARGLWEEARENRRLANLASEQAAAAARAATILSEASKR